MNFKDTEAKRAGDSIRELRLRKKLSPREFACDANLTEEYLKLLEEGHEDKVSDEIMERILQAGGVHTRGKYTSDDLKRVILSISPPNPPGKIKLF